MKILVRNLARSTSEADIKALFEPFGTVQYCKLVMDEASGASKGFAFVEMPKPGEAKAAIKTLNNLDLDGAKIRVKRAKAKSDEPAEDDGQAAQAAPE